MADPDFERRLRELFADAGEVDGAAAFAARVQGRLDRNWAFRRWAIGAAGLAGGVVAAFQAVQADLIGRASAVSHGADARVHTAAVDLTARGEALLALLRTMPAGAEALWMVSGLAALAVGLLAARWADAW